MKLNKPYKSKQYADFAVYCNKNGLIIEDKGDYLEAVNPPDPTVEEKQAAVRLIRNQYLSETDKYMIVDYPITDEQREEYKAYRVYLRTYPECQEWYESNPLTFDEWVQEKELATESKLNYLDTAQEMNDGTIQSGEGDISVSDEVVSDNTDTE